MNLEQTEAIKLCPLFSGISNKHLNIMLDCLKPKIKKYHQQETVADCGQPLAGIGIVARGEVALTKETRSGDRIIIDLLGRGEIFGETIAFSDIKTWPMTIIAHKDCVVLFLPPGKLTGICSDICASHDVLIRNMLQILSSKAIKLSNKIDILSLKNIRGKISSNLLEVYRQNNNSASIIVPMKRYELAEYLNVPRPSLSREMGLMRNEGIIEFKGPLIKIKDIAKLEESIL